MKKNKFMKNEMKKLVQSDFSFEKRALANKRDRDRMFKERKNNW